MINKNEISGVNRLKWARPCAGLYVADGFEINRGYIPNRPWELWREGKLMSASGYLKAAKDHAESIMRDL